MGEGIDRSSLQKAIDIKDYIVRMRRDLHQRAELGFQEQYTSDLIAQELRDSGLEVRTQIARTGVLGLLRGARPGKTLAFRAEMDALPIQEETGLPFASSNPGVMHACGHDGTMAIVLGVAKLMGQVRDEIAGAVKFIFSPSEESPPGGARLMVEEGVLEDPDVDFVISCHGDHTLPAGSIGFCIGETLASLDTFKLTIHGKGISCGTPHLGVDAIAVSAHLISHLQYLISRRVNPLDAAVISIGKIHGGVQGDTLADKVQMAGTVRALDSTVRERLHVWLETVIESVTRGQGASYSLEYLRGYPPLVTDKAMMDLLIECATRLVGEERVVKRAPLMAGDDLAYLFEKAPGCWFILGTSNPTKGIQEPIHTSKFDIDENALPIATGIMLEMAREVVCR